MSIHTRYADMPIIRVRQVLPYCRRLRDALNSDMVVEDGDPDLKCWFFE